MTVRVSDYAALTQLTNASRFLGNGPGISRDFSDDPGKFQDDKNDHDEAYRIDDIVHGMLRGFELKAGAQVAGWRRETLRNSGSLSVHTYLSSVRQGTKQNCPGRSSGKTERRRDREATYAIKLLIHYLDRSYSVFARIPMRQ